MGDVTGTGAGRGAASDRATKLFGRPRAIVGMVHVLALPGTPRATERMGDVIRRAVDDARLLAKEGFDALLLENMHDVPYLNRTVGPEIVASMTAVACAVRDAVDVPVGVQVLAGANHEALAVALAAGLTFMRAEGFVFASVADEGLMPLASAGPLLRHRRAIGAEHVAILADIKKKHAAHAITSDVTIAETAAAAEFVGADAVVMTGAATGEPTAVGDLDAARCGTSLPVVVGSGATAGSVATLLAHADAVIVGSDLKRDGRWSNELDAARVRAFAAAAKARP